MSLPSRRHPLRTLSRLLVAVIGLVLALDLTTPDAHADEIKIRGGSFTTKSAAPDKPFAHKRWKTTGTASWFRRTDADRDKRSADDFGVRLAAGSRLEQTVDVAPLTAPKGSRHTPNSSHWIGLLSVDLAATKSNSTATIVVTLTPPNGGPLLTTTTTTRSVDSTTRATLRIPADQFVSGSWTLRVSVPAGASTADVLVDDVMWFRVPVATEEMRFAKPNGKNGPDRIDSGALGFVAYTADRHAPLPVVAVHDDSPAATAGLRPGDVVIAVDGHPLPRSSCRPGHDWFRHGHEATLGRAVENALEKTKPTVVLTVMRHDSPSPRHLKLEVDPRPPLPKNFPFDDDVTPRLYDDMLAFVRRTRRDDGSWANGGNAWIQTTWAGLALLGRRDPQDRAAIKQAADWLLRKFPTPESFGNLGYWAAGYAGIFMSEYLLATGDDRVRPWIAAALQWVEDGFHTSKWKVPALGHGPNGLPYGNKALVAPATHVIVFEALAREAGFRSSIWNTVLPFMKLAWSNPKEGGHGSLGYNRSYRDKGEFWSRSGLFALAADLRGTQPVMKRSMIRFMRRRHAWMRNSHAYGNPGDAWGLIGVARVDEQAFREVMSAWRWAFGGAWQPGYGLRHSTAHMGSPYMGGEGLINPAFAAVFSIRHRGLVMTGARDRRWLDVNDIPTAPSAVRIERNHDGHVTMRPVVAAANVVVRYTLDGRDPTTSSPAYESPLDLSDGGMVTARTFTAKRSSPVATGPVVRRRLGISKGRWKVLDASGDDDPVRAKNRAAFLIDDDPRPWRHDVGRATTDLPYVVTLDLGRVRHFTGLAFTGGGVEKVRVGWSTTKTPSDALAQKAEPYDAATPNHEEQNPTKNNKRAQRRRRRNHKNAPTRIDFGQWVKARYLRVEIHAVSAKNKRPRIAELDLAWPHIDARREKGRLTFDIEDSPTNNDVVLRYTTDGSTPSKSSPVIRKPIAVDKDTVVITRMFNRSGTPLGPVRVWTK